MLLTETNIIHYLLDHGLVDAAAFVRGDFSCRTGQNRHTHFIVNKELDTHRYFVKQAFTNKEKSASLQREGIFYELAVANKYFQSLQKYLPEILLLDSNNSILVVEYLGEYVNLYDWLMDGHIKENGEKVALELAAALYFLHSINDKDVKELERQDFFYEFKPWILRLPEMKTLTGKTGRSEADENSLQLIFSIPGFVQLIEQAATLWEPSCIIHGDSKLNNFLLKATNNVPATLSFKIIDWELVNTGDPLWDMATVFQGVLTAWVISEDPAYKTNNNKTNFDTGLMQQFITTCWMKYAALHNWDKSTEVIKLNKCTGFIALRLLHACFETTPAAKSLRPHSARLLQLAHNILLDKTGTINNLLGINSQP
jgi:serine/threonine protein kinase